MIAVVTDAELLALAGVLVGGACHSATGFGFALVAAPLVVAALRPEQAISILLLLGILASALTLATERRTPDPLWRESGHILAWGAVGALAGAFLLDVLDRAALQLLVSISVVAALATRAFARRRERPPSMGRWVAPAGLAAGVLTTTTTTNGPPLILYLLGQRVPAAQMRDTLSVLFVSFGVVGVGALVVGQAEFTLPRAELSVGLAAATAAGHVAGRPLFARLAAGHYDFAVGALLFVSVVTGAVVALA
jgi:uncharacterized membrane protein YfcA